MAECLVLCEMGLEELSEMQMRCQSLAEQCETLENLGFVDFFGLEERTIPCKIRQGLRAYRCLFWDGVWHSGAGPPFLVVSFI